MSKRQKLYQRLLSKPKDLRFEELKKILLACGYTLDHHTGSHAVFVKPGARPLTIPHKTPIKSYLIAEALKEIQDCLEEKLATKVEDEDE